MAMPDSQRCPLKLWLIKYELDINVCNTKKDIIFNYSFSCTILLQENVQDISELNTFKT